MNNAAYSNNNFVGDDGKIPAKEPWDKHKSVELAVKSPNGTQAGDDYDPYLHRKVVNPLTNTETLLHLLKCALGTGIFSMPNAFKHAGYFVGFFGTIIIGSIATYCVHILINIHYELCKIKKVPCMRYAELAETALLSGPKCLHRFAPYMIHFVNIFLLAYQIGSCSIYVVFIATNFHALLLAFDIDIDVRMLMAIILLPLILINWVRNLKYLAPLSTLGNLIMIGSFGVICYYIFREPLTLEGKEPYVSITDFPQFFGTVLFALEAIGLIMPLENEMKTPKDFRGPKGVLNRAMLIVVALYTGLGLFGYLKYGNDIKATITVNLPEHELLAQLAKGMIAVGVFITHAIANYVAFDIAWKQYILIRIENSPRQLLYEYILRTGLVLLTFILAVAIPNLDIFISLVGALTLSTLGVAFPPLLLCAARWNRTSGFSKAVMVFKAVLISCIGLAGFLIGTSLSLKDIYRLYF